MRAFLLLAVLSAASGFYLPGVAPKDYEDMEKVEIKVNKLTSTKTQMPIDYYDLGICTPTGDNIYEPENMGEILTGNKIESTRYQINMNENVTCNILCHQEFDQQHIKDITHLIEESYSVNLIVDNLPGAVSLPAEEGEGNLVLYSHGCVGSYGCVGFSVAHVDENAQTTGAAAGAGIARSYTRFFLNNHVTFTLHYHEDAAHFTGKRIVRFEFTSDSVNHHWAGAKWSESPASAVTTCSPLTGIDTSPGHDTWQEVFQTCVTGGPTPCAKSNEKPVAQPAAAGGRWTCPSDGLAAACVPEDLATSHKTEMVFSYDVRWVSSAVRWASRWDIYLTMNNRFKDEVHWFSIINSLLIVFFLTGIVAMIMMRTLHKDLQRYNRVPTDEEKAEEREESGWKLIHGDIFRPPTTRPMLFAVVVGNGVQVLGMCMFTMAFATLGFLSPANRGSMMTALLVLFVVMGGVAGYWSARTFKMFNGKSWQKCTALTALLYPGFCFGMFFLINLFLWGAKSVAAIPFGTIAAIMALWFCVALPLTFFGAYLGYRREVAPFPVVTHNIPRQIPEQPWYSGSLLSVCIGGVLPFGVVFVELFFVLSSLWLDQYYYVFGFLLIVFIILIVACAEISIVLTYFQLCGEDYNWWWRSMLNSGSSAFYLFVYSVYYFFTRLEVVGFTPGLLYFGYMFLLSTAFFLLTGVVGYFSCLWFNVKIYAAIKVD